MRAALLLLALLIAGCGSSPVAPVELQPAATQSPQMLPRGNAEPTAAVEVTHLEAKLVTATWRALEYDDEGRGTVVERSGPAIEFTAFMNLHGWEIGDFLGSPGHRQYRWVINVEIDHDGGGSYDGFWNYNAIHETAREFGTMVTVHDWADEQFERDIRHGADLTMWAADQDDLMGRAGVRFSLPLEDFGLTSGPVRWKFFIADDYLFPYAQFIGITEGTVTRMETAR